MVFHGRVASHIQEEHQRVQSSEDLSDWLDWSMEFRNAIVKVLEDYILWLLDNKLPEKKLVEKKPWVEREFFFKLAQTKLPIFYSE